MVWGRDLLSDEWLEKLVRESERADTGGLAMCKSPDDFCVVATTQFAPTETTEGEGPDFEGYLFGNDHGLPKVRVQV